VPWTADDIDQRGTSLFQTRRTAPGVPEHGYTHGPTAASARKQLAFPLEGEKRSVIQYTTTVIGTYIQIDDVISIGGNDHRVVDMLNISSGKKIFFDDGNTYTLHSSQSISVKRLVIPTARDTGSRARVREIRWSVVY
jgi:hypothetical protein